MSFVNKVYAKFKVIPSGEADAAPPTPAMKKGVFYHGTTLKENADSIWKSGIKPNLNNFDNDVYDDEDSINPIADRVYCTNSIAVAFQYAVTGSYTEGGLDLKDAEAWIEDFDRYGYVFVIQGSQFKDIHPDEDQIGKAIAEKKIPWLTKLAEKELKDEECVDMDSCGYESLLKEIIQLKCYRCWIKAGKLLLPHLTDKQKIEIITKYGNVAHEGVLRPTEMWQIDRTQLGKYKPNGSNFFQVAKKVKAR